MQKIAILFFLVTIFSCSNNQTRQDKKNESILQTKAYPVKPLQIDSGEEEGWGADVRLSIVDKSENDTTTIYKALSTYQGKELGLIVCVPKRKEGAKGFGEGIILKSIGAQSDYLLQTLSKLYKNAVNVTARFVNDINVTYVNLKEFAKSLTGQEGQYTTANEYKLFFEGKGDNDYAEIFLNINPTENWIELREKDEEYRPMVLQFLTD